MASKTTYYGLDMPSYNEIADIDVINGNMDKIDVQMKKNADSAQQSKYITSDEYSATKTYAVGDYCIRENKLYRCKAAITTGESFDSSKWEQTTCGTEFVALNSNLDELKVSDVAGGKNLFQAKELNVNGDNIQQIIHDNFEENTQYTFSFTTKSRTSIDMGSFYFNYTDGTYINMGWDTTVGASNSKTSDKGKTIKTIEWKGWNYGEYASFSDIQIEKGITATPYEPYIPSVKMLADEVNAQNDSLSVIGKCKNLLNPTLHTTSAYGVTCTANGDGTYTLNGTSTDITYFQLSSQTFDLSKTYKIVGCPKGGVGKYSIYDDNNIITGTGDKGNGGNPYKPSVNPRLFINIQANVELNNVVFKPMLTENLNATYDDFVPYTGDGETLTHDVAELKNDLSVKKFELVAGALWLCVSGKHCVLTLNGYNLTETTYFDKLKEYQPYLVARNVVSKGDGVCIAAVDPNGNINASDLVVGTQLTGQLFGEISWIANI